ncbi:MAG: T9SS type A sorting domain-containing protein, partial [Chitinophagales bacterium]|nr:T9SS type A sorting domain-containing protein [Chitinophagales bacterium]
GYILGGWSGSGISGDKTQSSQGFDDYWIVKIDTSGIKEWDKRFGGTQFEQMHGLDQTSDEGYILGGLSGSGVGGDKTEPSQGIEDYWMVKTDSLGIKVWDKRFGGSGWERNVRSTSQTPDGGYIISGVSDSPISGDKTENNYSPGDQQGWVVKTDSSGIKVWDITVLTNGYDRGAWATAVDDTLFAFAIETDGGIAGYKTQTNQGSDDYWLITFSDSATFSAIVDAEIKDDDAVMSVNPNPFTESLEINYTTERVSNVSIELFNSLGGKVATINAGDQEAGEYNSTLDAKQLNLNAGIYILHLRIDDKLYTKRIIRLEK